MADNVVVTAGTGTTVAADEVVDGTLGTVKVQYVKLMDGTLDGTTKAAVGASGLQVTQRPATSGGLSHYTFLSTAAVQADNVKASAGQAYDLQFFNNQTTPVFVRLYDKATAPLTSDPPIWRGMVPGATGAAGVSVHFPTGLTFASGIGVRVTGAAPDNDATALSANVVMGNIQYA